MKILAACGNDCSVCPRYTAPPYEKTGEELQHTAELWMKIGYRDHVVTNDEIACSGCRPENRCRYRVIKCCAEKGIKTCAACPAGSTVQDSASVADSDSLSVSIISWICASFSRKSRVLSISRLIRSVGSSKAAFRASAES